MASKEKLLASAQKHLKKKAFPRAIKDFVKVVEIDPNDMRSRQKLAELYTRTNKPLDAYEQYETVAKYFSSNGFYLKAIAIYRQMQRLDPSQVSIHIRLAEMNEKQGLIGNAMSEYGQLVNHYEKNDMMADAIRILERMAELDAVNLNIRVKLAEVLTSSGQTDAGREHLMSTLSTLQEKQDFDKLLKLYKKFIPLFPNDNDIQRGLASTLLAKGENEKGLSLLQKMLREAPEDLDLLRMLATTYRDLEDLKNSRLTYQQALKLDPSDLDMREQLIDCCLNGQEFEQALAELEEWKEALQKAGRIEKLKTAYETLKLNLPDNQSVLQTLDSIYDLTGDSDKLFDIASSDSEGASYAVEEEGTVFDSLLDTADEDIEEDEIIELDELDSPEEEEEGEGFVALSAEDELTADEPVEDEEILELEISDELQFVAEEEDSLDLDFDLGEEEELPPTVDLQGELEEAEFYLQQGLLDEAERVCRALVEQNPDSAECRAKLDEVLAGREDQEPEKDAASELHDLATEVLEEGFPDLVMDSLDNILDVDADGLDELLDITEESPVFRTDVDDQIAADDMESHYNLGIAYREMGLFDDAISEFDKAQADPSRFVDCQTLKGLCYADKGDIVKSEEAFNVALSSSTIDQGQRLGLHYELGMLYERFQRIEAALDNYRLVAEGDPDFRDIAEKISSLSNNEEGASESGSSKDRISFL